MTIKTLEYEDRQRRWKLERTEFDAFNLLVGVSGAGKTSVIQALREVRSMGLGLPWEYRPGSERSWCIELQADDGHVYRWEAEISAQEGTTKQSWQDQSPDAPRPNSAKFVRERITETTQGQGNDIVERSPEQFLFAGKQLPRLKDTESAISLLGEEALIAPLHRALDRILLGRSDPAQASFVDPNYVEFRKRQPPDSSDRLRENTAMPLVLQTYLARLHFPELFESIRTHYLDIFDSVTDVTVDIMERLDPAEAQVTPFWDELTLAIKEHGTDGWIVEPYISLGMRRTFYHLAELELAPPGTTIVVDEYENSMGVNCLPAVTDLFLRRQDALQFILTSHHPYVIDNVPMDWWRVVTRHGGTISVRPARDIPELNTRSRQDAFTLLLNSSVYQEGIQ